MPKIKPFEESKSREAEESENVSKSRALKLKKLLRKRKQQKRQVSCSTDELMTERVNKNKFFNVNSTPAKN